MEQDDGKAQSSYRLACASVYGRPMSRPVLALWLAFFVPFVAAAAEAPRAFATVEEFARAIGMKPGGWHTKFTVTSIEVELPPGTDPALLEPVKAAMPLKVGSVQEQHECAGPAQGVSLPGILLSRDCSFSRMESGDGRWAIRSTCPMPGGGMASASAHGTHDPESVTGAQVLEVSLGGLVAHVKGDIVSHYTGPQCRPPAPPVSVTVTLPKRD